MLEPSALTLLLGILTSYMTALECSIVSSSPCSTLKAICMGDCSFSRNDYYLVLEITTVFDTSLEKVFSTYCYLNAYWPTERSVLVKPQSVIKSFFG